MRRYVIAVAGLAWVAGCAPQTPPDVILPTPLPGETLADPADPNVNACLTVVSRNLGTPGVIATGIVSGPLGTTVTVDADGTTYQCNIDAQGRVTSMVRL